MHVLYCLFLLLSCVLNICLQHILPQDKLPPELEATQGDFLSPILELNGEESPSEKLETSSISSNTEMSGVSQASV